MKRWQIRLAAVLWMVVVVLANAGPASAHESPEGAAWLLADWMLLAFLVFFGVALIVFLTAIRRGHLSNLEEAKYYVLAIDEPDFYTPEWARTDNSAPGPEQVGGNGATAD